MLPLKDNLQNASIPWYGTVEQRQKKNSKQILRTQHRTYSVGQITGARYWATNSRHPGWVASDRSYACTQMGAKVTSYQTLRGGVKLRNLEEFLAVCCWVEFRCKKCDVFWEVPVRYHRWELMLVNESGSRRFDRGLHAVLIVCFGGFFWVQVWNSFVGDQDLKKSIVFTRFELPLTVRTQMVAKVTQQDYQKFRGRSF